jgi:hypothetical protein
LESKSHIPGFRRNHVGDDLRKWIRGAMGEGPPGPPPRFTPKFFGANLRSMDLSAFRASLGLASPPPALSQAMRALWLDAKGDWDGAHGAAQADEGGAGDWVHAYLHRKEGDAGNAAYWYRRARKPVCKTSLEQEWEAIAKTLLEAEDGS